MSGEVLLSILQFTPQWGDKKKNFDAIDSLTKDLTTDILVLPELCTTGYSFLTKAEAFAAAESIPGYTSAYFLELSKKLKCVIVAGIAEKDGEQVYNSAFIALPDGNHRTYRKTHLFFKEKVCFDEGNKGFFVINHPFKDCIIGTMVCYDWRFPESARSLALAGADVIVCPSNLVTNVWHIAMPARALENKVYVAVPNRCGTEERMLGTGTRQTLLFTGKSVIYDFMGSVMSQADSEETKVLTVKINPGATRDKSFNEYNNVFNDRRPGFYNQS